MGVVRLARHADDAISLPRAMGRACRPGSEPRSTRTAGDIEIASWASVFRASRDHQCTWEGFGDSLRRRR